MTRLEFKPDSFNPTGLAASAASVRYFKPQMTGIHLRHPFLRGVSQDMLVKVKNSSSKPTGGTIMVTWKTFPFVIIFIATLILVSIGTPHQQLVAKWSFVIVCAAILLFAILKLLLFGILTRHPANKIVTLLRENRVDEAESVARTLLLQFPDDVMVRLNGAAAMFRAGKIEDARSLFGSINRKSVPKVMLQVYDHWDEHLTKK